MMKAAYVELFAGAAGDMLLGALVDAGLEISDFVECLRSMAAVREEWALEVRSVHKSGGRIAAVKVDVTVMKEQEHHRTFADVSEIILGAAEIPDEVKQNSIRAFRYLAEAEAKIHGTTMEKVHFHEVGAIDSIIDTVGVILGFYMMGITEIYCSSVPLAPGYVNTQHGLLPVPAPATALLLRNHFVTHQAPDVMRGELVTPTAVSLLRALVPKEHCGRFPQSQWRIDSVGIGAGTRECPEYPNVCRIMIGTIEKKFANPNATPYFLQSCSSPQWHNHEHSHGHSRSHGHDHTHDHPEKESHSESEKSTNLDNQSAASSLEQNLSETEQRLLLLETNIDDMSAELFGFLMEELMAIGALDVWFTPIQMKKNRPAVVLTVLCELSSEKEVLRKIFRESTTFGVRKQTISRVRCKRKFEIVQTEFGPIHIKIAFDPFSSSSTILTASPEFEDCKALARSHNVPLLKIYNIAKSTFHLQQQQSVQEPPFSSS